MKNNKGFGLLLAALLIGLVACGGRSADKRDPQADVATKVRMAQSLFNAGRVNDALAQVQEAMAMEPRNPSLRNFYGLVSMAAGMDAQAEAAFLRALEMDPRLTDARNNLGALYHRMGRKDEAESQFQVALADPGYPTPEKVHFNLGLLYASQGFDEKAITSMRRAVGINSRFYQAQYELASLLDKTGNLEEAARLYEFAAPDFRNNGEYHYRLGFVYLRLGDPIRAEQHLRRALDVAPGSEAAAKAGELLKVVR
jgi:type IV pilus biogenesis/stability protein PilW